MGRGSRGQPARQPPLDSFTPPRTFLQNLIGGIPRVSDPITGQVDEGAVQEILSTTIGAGPLSGVGSQIIKGFPRSSAGVLAANAPPSIGQILPSKQIKVKGRPLKQNQPSTHAAGSYNVGKKEITIDVKDLNNPGVVQHEIGHHVFEAMLSPAQKRTIRGLWDGAGPGSELQAQVARNAGKIPGGAATGPGDMLEWVADEFAMFKSGKHSGLADFEATGLLDDIFKTLPDVRFEEVARAGTTVTLRPKPAIPKIRK